MTECWKSGQKRFAMVGGWVVKMKKQRGFQGVGDFSIIGGLAPAARKCEFPREKCDRYGFTPLKRPGFLLKRREMMPKPSEIV